MASRRGGRVVRLKKKGFYEVRRAPRLQILENEIVRSIAAECNEHVDDEGYRTSSVQGKRKPYGRWRATVITATQQAKNDNEKNDRLRKAVYARRK